jgi:IgA Peptidase M64
MIDLTISPTPLGDGRIRYTLGRANWQDRRIPDLRRPGATVTIPEDRMVDIVILGDGFTTTAQFESSLAEWLADFYALKVYEVYAGCLRIRALYTPSSEPASADRGSFYRSLVKEDGSGLDMDEWWSAGDPDGDAFVEAFWTGVDTFADVNTRCYPLDLEVGTNQAITDGLLRDLYRNLVVSFLVRTATTVHPSGFCRDVARPAPNTTRRVRVGFGANEIHEFGHAFGLLADEYINGRGTVSTRVNPATPSVFSLSNLTYSSRLDGVPWVHLSPGGWQIRSASGEEPSPLAGWLWVGGSVHNGVWHSEYRCLMNGSHDNFEFTQIAADDPTANTDGTYTDENGAGLRDSDRFCLWCQEIVAIRILERTDQLLQAGDPGDTTAQGVVWYDRWIGELRADYQRLFDVAQQIDDNEARYAGLNPGAGGEPLWRSDLYSVPTAIPPGPASAVPPLADEELLLLTA